MPDVSVIIPVFNGRKMVAAAIEAAVGQIDVDHEVIVVDDGSTDGTAELLESRPSEFRLIRHAKNRGGGMARNSGAHAASGRWLAFLDADDTWAPDRLARSLKHLDEAKFAIAACEWSRPERRGTHVLPQLPPDITWAQLLAAPPIGAGSTLIVDRDLFKDIGGFDPALPRHQDWDLVIRLANETTGTVIRESLVTLNRSGRPTYELILAAKRIFLSKHKHLLAKLTPQERRRAVAEHRLDLARFAYYSHRWLRVAQHLAETAITDPTLPARWVRDR